MEQGGVYSYIEEWGWWWWRRSAGGGQSGYMDTVVKSTDGVDKVGMEEGQNERRPPDSSYVGERGRSDALQGVNMVGSESLV